MRLREVEVFPIEWNKEGPRGEALQLPINPAAIIRYAMPDSTLRIGTAR